MMAAIRNASILSSTSAAQTYHASAFNSGGSGLPYNVAGCFTSVTGLGAVIMLGSLALPILVGAGLSGTFAAGLMLFAIALAVGIAPELLPAIMTVNLARGAQSMAKRGVIVRQIYDTADLGTLAYECPEENGMHISDDLYLEICDPATGEPLPEGQVGEVVVTPFSNACYPLVRYGTGDLSVGEMSKELQSKGGLDKATADIKSGAVVVHDFRSDKACPV